jgi:hypothetical protein
VLDRGNRGSNFRNPLSIEYGGFRLILVGHKRQRSGSPGRRVSVKQLSSDCQRMSKLPEGAGQATVNLCQNYGKATVKRLSPDFF